VGFIEDPRGLAAVGLISADWTVLAVFLACIAAMWVLSTMHHAVGSGTGTLTHAGASAHT